MVKFVQASYDGQTPPQYARQVDYGMGPPFSRYPAAAHALLPGQDHVFSRYPAAAHSLLPYDPSALSGLGNDAFSAISTSPVLGLARLAQRTRAHVLMGLGQDADAPPPVDGAMPEGAVVALGALAVVGVLVLAAVGVASYQTGKAVAPSEDEERRYGWYGVGAGLVGGPIGLGLLALAGGRNRE